MIAPYIVFDGQLVRFTVFSLPVNGFAPITQSKSLQDTIGPLSGLAGVKPEVYGRKSGQDSKFCYIMYLLFDMLLDEVGNNVWYEVGTNQRDLNNFQVPETDGTLPMVFATVKNSMAREMDVEQPGAHASEVIDLKDGTCVSNRWSNYSTPGHTKPMEGDWEAVQSRKRPHS